MRDPLTNHILLGFIITKPLHLVVEDLSHAENTRSRIGKNKRGRTQCT